MRYDLSGNYVAPPLAPGYDDDEPHLPLWERGRPWPPEMNSLEHNAALLEHGLPNSQDEFWIAEIYGDRVHHTHRIYGHMLPPRLWNHLGGLVGPVMQEGRSLERAVYLDCREPDRRAYVSAVRSEDGDAEGPLVEIFPFADDIEHFGWMIGYDRGATFPPGIAPSESPSRDG